MQRGVHSHVAFRLGKPRHLLTRWAGNRYPTTCLSKTRSMVINSPEEPSHATGQHRLRQQER
jgi:hypothetical protein